MVKQIGQGNPELPVAALEERVHALERAWRRLPPQSACSPMALKMCPWPCRAGCR